MAKTVYEFAIKKDVLNSGKTIFTPVCRKKTIWGRLFPNSWERITNIYDEYLLMELDFIPELTYKDCEEHIAGYQKVLEESVENEVATVEFHNLEEQEI
jgi:hypothetical protein